MDDTRTFSRYCLFVEIYQIDYLRHNWAYLYDFQEWLIS